MAHRQIYRMVKIGIFGQQGDLDPETIDVLLDEIIDQCCERFNSSAVNSLVSHASGYGLSKYVFEIGELRGTKTLGMILPSCQKETWYPSRGIEYIDESGTIHEEPEPTRMLDIAIWIGELTPYEDWEKLSNIPKLKLITVSEHFMDWGATTTWLNLHKVQKRLIQQADPTNL